MLKPPCFLSLDVWHIIQHFFVVVSLKQRKAVRKVCPVGQVLLQHCALIQAEYTHFMMKNGGLAVVLHSPV